MEKNLSELGRKGHNNLFRSDASMEYIDVLPIIDWSLRYYALASLLLLLAITGAKVLTQEKGVKREYIFPKQIGGGYHWRISSFIPNLHIQNGLLTQE